MSDGPARAFSLVGILILLASGGAIAGEEAGTPTSTVPDAGASDAAPAKGAEPGSPSATPEASESGGLFEQSQSAAAATAAPERMPSSSAATCVATCTRAR